MFTKMNPLLKFSSTAIRKNVVTLLTSITYYQPQVLRALSCMTEGPLEFPPNPDFRIEISRGPGDVHELKNVLKQTFFRDEPSIQLFGLTGGEYCGELLDAMMQGITFEESLIAKCNYTNEMIGCALNGEYNPEKFEHEVDRWINSMKEARNKKLLALWRSMSQQFNFTCVRPSSRAMEIYYLGVVPKARKKGIAKKLVCKSLDIAKCRGYGIVQVVCTSCASAAICKSLDMKQACIVEYDTLRMPWDGRPVVTKPPPPPNENVKIYYHTIC